MRKRILALALAMSLLLTACGGGASAATMHLRKTEGTVGVSDGDGKGVELRENLGLYSGYGVDTSSESYAWIDLDSVKLTKLDQDSEIAITKEGKHLEIEVKSGSLFFNVTQPLADDESMNIRTSTMAVGIQGTCGWVVSNGDQGAQLFLLEGTVEAEATDTGETVQVTAGNMAEVTVNENGETEITVQPFAEEYIAPFVLAELEDNDALCAAILEDSNLDILNPPDPAQRLRKAYQEIIAQQTVYDHYAAVGSAYTANGIHYSADEGLSEAFLSDLDGDGMQELVMVYRFYQDTGIFSYRDVFNTAPIQKIEVYGQSMGYPVLYDTLDVTACQPSPGRESNIGIQAYSGTLYHFLPNQYCLVGDGAVQTLQLYADYSTGGTVRMADWGNCWYYAFENGAFSLLDHHDEAQQSDWAWSNEKDEGDHENLCPAFPDDVLRKQAMLSVLVDCEGLCFGTRLVDINRDGKDELYMLISDYDAVLAEYCAWDGESLNYTELANEHGYITYGKLIDMDQDGEDELLLIMDDGNAIAYSWKGASWERALLNKEEWACEYNGFYRDTVTGDICLGGQTWFHGGEGEGYAFISLTDRFEYSYSAADFSASGGNFNYELTPDELEEFFQAADQYSRDLERFELIEDITDLYGGGYNESNFAFYEQLQPTVDQVRQQLMAR